MTDRIGEIITEHRERQVQQAWVEILRSHEGRLVIWSILEFCHLFSQTHAGDAHDGFRAGMREVGLRILHERVFPNDARTFAAMQQEHAELMDRIQFAAEQQAEKEESDE